VSGIPPLYTCEVCGFALRPQDNGCSRLAIVWLRGKTNTVAGIVEDLHRYKHDVCEYKNPNVAIQDALF
jgi:hypothetical protein